MTRPVILALPKGRILDEAAKVFKTAGYDLSPVFADNRKLVHECGMLRVLLSPDMKFPLIVKPNAEGSSKGIGSTSIADNEEQLRIAVKECVEKYRQPALVEEYISGREFTVGLLGDKRPRVLPPMEIKFKKQDSGENARPVYDYAVKQDWEEYVYYECPAKLTEAEQKAMEKIARATFWALDCRDVARVDLRMDAEGRIYVLEVNPLPGLTPDYSDLVLIAKACGMEYDQLIAEIMTGGLRRLREKKREEREEQREREAASNQKSDRDRERERDKADRDKEKAKRERDRERGVKPEARPAADNPANATASTGNAKDSAVSGSKDANAKDASNGNGAKDASNGNGAKDGSSGSSGGGLGVKDAKADGTVRTTVKRERSEPVADRAERAAERAERTERERAERGERAKTDAERDDVIGPN
jgi:biotin carboxylase